MVDSAVFAIAVAAAVISLTMEPVYEATTTIMVQEQGSSAEALLSMGGLPRTLFRTGNLESRRIYQVKARMGMEEVTKSMDRLTIQTVQGTDILR